MMALLVVLAPGEVGAGTQGEYEGHNWEAADAASRHEGAAEVDHTADHNE